MKFSLPVLLSALLSSSLALVGATCSSNFPATSTTQVEVKLLGSVPTNDTAAGSYNFMPADGFKSKNYILDQKNLKIYEFRGNNGDLVFDYHAIGPGDDAGLQALKNEINPPTKFLGFSAVFQGVHAILPGPDSKSVYVVMTSLTLPPSLTIPPERQIPDPSVFQVLNSPEDLDKLLFEHDLIYKVFYKMDVGSQGVLENPVPFFAMEMLYSPGHLGGGALTVDDQGTTKILWAVGDGLPFGVNGLEPSQLDTTHFGKILLIDPATGTSTVAAKGVRNSQQMNLVDDNVVFMDIGGVSAEEINVVPLADLLDTSVIENFGWGIQQGDDWGREGTYKIAPGVPQMFGGNPPCIADLTEAEQVGFIKPWTQFGRGDPNVFLFAISGSVISKSSLDKCTVFFTEFQTGLPFCLFDEYQVGTVATTHFVELVDEDGTPLEYGFNSLVCKTQNIPDAVCANSFASRGDPRPFLLYNNKAAVLIERTGEVYEVKEIKENRKTLRH